MENPRCPICRAAGGNSVTCARCKANLTPILKVVKIALRLREKGRVAFLHGDFSRAIRYLKKSIRLQESPRARKFLFLAKIFNETGNFRTPDFRN